MKLATRRLRAVLVITLALAAGCASQVEVAIPVTGATAVTQPTAPAATPELRDGSSSEEVDDTTLAPAPTIEVPATTTEPPPVIEEKTAIEEDQPQGLASIDLPDERALGGRLGPGDKILLFANRGDTLDRSSIELLGDFELLDVVAVFGEEALAFEELPQPVSSEDLALLERRLRLTFDPGDEDLTGLDAAVANDSVMVMASLNLILTICLPNERALNGEIGYGDVVGLARLDGTVLGDQVEILDVSVDSATLDLSAPITAAAEFFVTLRPRSSIELLDTALAILRDDIQLTAG